MVFNLNKKTKISIVISLVLILVGLSIFGFFGFNKSVDYSRGYSIEVSAPEITKDKIPLIKDTADAYFAENGLNVFKVQTINEGETLIYVFGGRISNLQDYATGVKNYVQSALDQEVTGYKVEVDANVTTYYNNNQYLGVLLALLVSVIVMIIYLAIFEKISGAFTTIIIAGFSAFMYLLMLAITRIPTQPFMEIFLVVSAGIGTLISSVIIHRSNEALKTSGNEKTPRFALAEKMTWASLVRIAFMGGLALLCGLLLTILGNFYLKTLGLHLIVSTICGVFSSFAYTSLIWSILKKDKKRSKPVGENN